MPRHRPTDPVDEPREFRVEDLFFSVTDEKGLIRHGNEVFCRISGYGEEDLFGAPHNIIRHPDMPRAVFQVLWDTIQAGRSIAAYVKNMASDGRYYWVLAVVMPCDGGYLSVRLKPVSPLLTTVTALYADLLALEQQVEERGGRRREAIAASVEQLGLRLSAAGFTDYGAFMREALSTEVSARHRQLGGRERPAPTAAHDASGQALRHGLLLDDLLQRVFDRLDEFKTMSASLSEASRRILATADDISLLALNASISASGLGQRGETLRVVARALGTDSTRIRETIEDLTRQTAHVVGVLDGIIFDLAATKLQSEVGVQFAAERLADGGRDGDGLKAGSLRILQDQVARRAAGVFDDLRQAVPLFEALGQQTQTLLRRNKALRFVQFAGQKEAVGGESMATLFRDAERHVERTYDECRGLSRTIADVQRHVAQTRAIESQVLAHVAAFGTTPA